MTEQEILQRKYNFLEKNFDSSIKIMRKYQAIIQAIGNKVVPQEKRKYIFEIFVYGTENPIFEALNIELDEKLVNEFKKLEGKND